MTTRIFSNPRQPLMLKDGVTPNAKGKIFFYEPGEGSTAEKRTYNSPEFVESNRQKHPIETDLAGIPPAIFLDGDYRVVITDSSGAPDEWGVKLTDIPNYQAAELDAQFQDWAANLTYKVNDFARGSNGKYYQSIDSNNKGNDPTITPSKWVEIYFIDVWNASKEYSLDDIVKYQDDMWVSLQNSNTGNTPSASSTYWRSFFTPSVVTDYTAASFEYRHSDGYAPGLFIVNGVIPSATFESVGPTGSGADNIWTALDQIPSEAKTLIVRASYGIVRESTTDDFVTLEFNSRQTGGSATTGSSIVVSDSSYGGAASNTATLTGNVEFTVPIDANLRFDFRHDVINSTSINSITLRLAGYKV